MSRKNIYDAVVIGGGFYGCILALFLKKKFKRVLLIEKETNLLLKASYNNQARVHNGYHYPRSFITALRSHVNYTRFISDFRAAIIDKYSMVYAIAANNSKVTSNQFIKFCNLIGAPLLPAPEEIRNLFDDRLIEDIFMVDEVIFNSAILRKMLKRKLNSAKVKILYKHDVTKVSSVNQLVSLSLASGENIFGRLVINCAYSGINRILINSSLPKLPLKHEVTEMPLVKMPTNLSCLGFTVMDGPFFSVMPFPDKKMHTIHHVRYTPHDSTSGNIADLTTKDSNFLYMIKDATRYMPVLSKVVYKSSLYETKTVLITNEITDARPILFKINYGIKNFHIVLGAKIDNIYDIIEEINKFL